MVDWENAKESAKNVTQGAVTTAEEKAKEYWYGDSSSDPQLIGVQDYETVAPDDCIQQLEAPTTLYWNVVIFLVAYFLATIVVPYVVCCCAKKCVKWQAYWYYLAALINLIVGGMAASPLLVPECPSYCGAVCNAHKYNPGPVWGGMFVAIGFFWSIKGCCTMRYAKRLHNEQAAASAAERIPMTDPEDDQDPFHHGGYKDSHSDDNELL